MIAKRGDLVTCVSAPDYMARLVTRSRGYVVNDVKHTPSGAYYRILCDPNYGEWVLTTLFTSANSFEPIDATGWAEAAFDPPAKPELISKEIWREEVTVKSWRGFPGDPWNGKTVTFSSPGSTGRPEPIEEFYE